MWQQYNSENVYLFTKYTAEWRLKERSVQDDDVLVGRRAALSDWDKIEIYVNVLHNF